MRLGGKIAIASASIGIAVLFAFIGGALSTPPVALQFCGYRTNIFEESSDRSTQQITCVSALFCLTNGSARAIVSRAPSSRFRLRLASRTGEGWAEQTRFLCSVDSNQGNLAPSNAVNFSIFQTDFSRPLRASVDFSYLGTGNKPWERVLRWMRGSQTNRSVLVVIQDS